LLKSSNFLVSIKLLYQIFIRSIIVYKVITFIVILPNKMKIIKKIFGGAFRKAKYEIRRRKARVGKNSFLPTPFLFTRPSVQFGARSALSVSLKIGSDFVKIARDSNIQEKKVAAKEIFGSNLRLTSRAVRGEPVFP